MAVLFPFFGLILGLIGVGTGIIILPLLSTIYQIEFQQAVNLTLFISACMTFSGFVCCYKGVDYKIVLKYFLLSLIGAFLGSYYSNSIEQIYKEIIFISIILFILFKKKNNKEKEDVNWFLFLLATILTGFLTSILGVGGGFLIIPILMHFFNMNIKEVIKTSLLITFLNTTISLIINIYMLDGYNELYINLINYKWTISILLLSFLMGRLLTKVISEKNITIIYKSLLIISVGLMLYN